MNVSVVIPTYNRGERLGPTLDALLASDTSGLDAVEIIVVDDGSPEPVAPVVESRVACPPISLRCIRRMPGPPRPATPGFGPLVGRSCCSSMMTSSARLI